MSYSNHIDGAIVGQHSNMGVTALKADRGNRDHPFLYQLKKPISFLHCIRNITAITKRLFPTSKIQFRFFRSFWYSLQKTIAI